MNRQYTPMNADMDIGVYPRSSAVYMFPKPGT
jgi:hypothetical protein